MATSVADLFIVTVLVTVGIPGLAPIPLADTLAVAALAALFSFGVNDHVTFRLLGNGESTRPDLLRSEKHGPSARRDLDRRRTGNRG